MTSRVLQTPLEFRWPPPSTTLGVLAVALQMCLVYVTSGLYKVQRQLWQDGTALFYVMRVPEFSLPGVSEIVYNNDFLVLSGAYATVIFLVYFPLGILVPRLRPWAAVTSMGFHISIAVFMGLTDFALTMVACDLILLSRGISEALAWTARSGSSLAALARVRLGWPKEDTAPVPLTETAG
jgi:hypothetical protein